MVWVKICGITDIEDAVKISNLGADALGFISFSQSPRRIEPLKAKKIMLSIKSALKEKAKIPAFVGVFVNEKVKKVIEISKDIDLDYIQLSGDEDLDYLKRIKDKVGNIKIIKLVRIKEDSLIEYIYKKLYELRDEADYFLLDTFKKNMYGGTGQPFNWDMVRTLSSKFPIILAGGLDHQNVKEAIRIVKPFGVDASTRLELYAGKKNIKKVKLFIKNAVS